MRRQINECKLPPLGVCCFLLMSSLWVTEAVAENQLHNGDFDNGLNDWQHQGLVTCVDGVAILGEGAPGAATKLWQNATITIDADTVISFSYRFNPYRTGPKTLTPPDSFQVLLLDGNNNRFGFLVDGEGDIISQDAFYYIDTDGVQQQSARVNGGAINISNVDASGFVTVEIKPGQVLVDQNCLIEFGLASSDNECDLQVEIEMCNIPHADMGLVCPDGVEIDCNDSILPQYTGYPIVNNMCTDENGLDFAYEDGLSAYLTTVDSLSPTHHWRLNEEASDDDLVGEGVVDRKGAPDGSYSETVNGGVIMPRRPSVDNMDTCDKAIQFSGQSYAEVPHTIGENGSISVWIKCLSSVTNAAFISKYDGNPADGWFKLYTQSDGSIKASLWATVSGQLQELTVESSTGSISADKWYHIVFTFEESTELTLYIYDTDENSTTGDSVETELSQFDLTGGSTQPLHLGSDGTTFFSGQMDEVIWFDDVLTSGEVDSLHGASGDSFERTWTVTDTSCTPNEREETCVQSFTVVSCGCCRGCTPSTDTVRIIFMIDGSSGMPGDAYNSAKQAVKAVLSKYPIDDEDPDDPNRNRPLIGIGQFGSLLNGGVGAVVYDVSGADPGPEYYSQDYSVVDDIVDGMNKPTGINLTPLAAAIDAAHARMPSQTLGEYNYIVLLTDGFANIPGNDDCEDDGIECECTTARNAVVTAAQGAKSDGVKIYAVLYYSKDGGRCPYGNAEGSSYGVKSWLEDNVVSGENALLDITHIEEIGEVNYEDVLSCAFEEIVEIINCDDGNDSTEDRCVNGGCRNITISSE